MRMPLLLGGFLALCAVGFSFAAHRFLGDMATGAYDCVSKECQVQRVNHLIDDVEMTNCGKQLEWVQEQRGEMVAYRTPEFKFRAIGESK